MQMKILDQKDNPLLFRKYVSYELVFEGKVPSMKDVKTAVAKSAKTTEDLIVIRRIKNEFGMRKAKVSAYVYKDKEKLELVEGKEEKKKKETKGEETEEKKEGKQDGKEEKKEKTNK